MARLPHESLQHELAALIATGTTPPTIVSRLTESRSGKRPWIATLTPAELRIVRSHGIKPLCAISATCWMFYRSWTLGHRDGWNTALTRLRNEAAAAGANAVLDVKMRTIPSAIHDSMDFTLIGTAVVIEGLASAASPIVATVPALEFVKLLEADVVPTGIAVGAHYEWWTDANGIFSRPWRGNIEATQLSDIVALARTTAHADLRTSALTQGNGVLANVNFSQLLAADAYGPRRYLARHIVVATTVDANPSATLPEGVSMVVDMHAGKTPLTGSPAHHQSYESNEREGAI
jgi:hypothetical protein